MDRCPECGGYLARVRTTVDTRVGRRTVAVSGEFLQCQGECREVYFAPGESDEVSRRATDMARAEEGLLTPQEIREIRRQHDLTQQQLEQLLNVGPKTVVRWERGTVMQNAATDTLLRLLRDVPAVYRHLLRTRERVLRDDADHHAVRG
jgi:HTH-type transcriptional regulator/antitoxin MqsA